ncbi:MAG TPA: primosomal protein N', partial [Candidatus Bathyarchaeia archaeon]|nr:primosomal protein N' [Candidatus Bathyarchaeia archaeon]
QAPMVSAPLLELARWLADYYGCSFGEAIAAALPFSVRNRKRLAFSPPPEKILKKTPALSLYVIHDDEAGYEAIVSRMKETLAAGRGVLILAPDSDEAERLAEVIAPKVGGKIARLDTGASKKYTQDWLALKNGEVSCALGVRSAVFAPVNNLGLIVMTDEDHYGYKEDQTPYYHAREVVLKHSAIEGSDVIFSSAAPSVELWHAIACSGGEVKTFFKKDMAPLQIVDLANYKPRKESALSFPVANEVGRTLEAGGKVLVFFNRRGFHTMVKCEGCGHVIKCPRCEVPLVYLYEEKIMSCPSCNFKQAGTSVCPECGDKNLNRYGEGIERIESDLARFFPQARLATFDRTKKQLSKGWNIIVATEAIVKHLNGMAIAATVVLDIDSELSRHDLRGHQKVLSLLLTLRKYTREKIFVQTRQPSHPAIQAACSLELDRFYQQELKSRQELEFPPFKHLIAVMIRGKKEGTTAARADDFFKQLSEHPLAGFEVLPPQPDFRPKLRDQYRYIIMGKAFQVEVAVKHIRQLLAAMKRKSGVIVTLDVDA